MTAIKIPDRPELNIDDVRQMETYDRNTAKMFNEYFQIFLGNDKNLEERIKEQEDVLTDEELEKILI